MGFQLICTLHGVDLIKLPVKATGIQQVSMTGLVKPGLKLPDGPLTVWQNHICAIPRCPDGFEQYGHSENGVEMIVHKTRFM
jgi:GMP synthase-like glutamine amidotransferase